MRIELIKEFVKNINEKQLKIPVLLIGQTGIGKSWSMKELAKELGIDFVDLRLATQEVTDLIGYPRMIKREGKDPVTVWTKPEWFPDEGTRGILALEEVNRAPEDVRQAIFQLLTEWKLHTHKLPATWTIVSMVNPDNGEYHVNKLDKAFKRRFVQIVVDPPEVDEWGVWAKKNNVKNEIIQFVFSFPRLLHTEESIKIDAYPTPDGWRIVSLLLTNNVIPYSKHKDDNPMLEITAGIIGNEAASGFIQALRKGLDKYLTCDDILNNYSRHRDYFKQVVEKKRNDLIYMSVLDLLTSLNKAKKITNKQAENLRDFMLDVPAENLVVLVKEFEEVINNKLSQYDELCNKLLEVVKAAKELRD